MTASVLRLSKLHSTSWITPRKHTFPSLRVCTMTLSQAKYDSELVLYWQRVWIESTVQHIRDCVIVFAGINVQGLCVFKKYIYFNLDLGRKHWIFLKSIATFLESTIAFRVKMLECSTCASPYEVSSAPCLACFRLLTFSTNKKI